MSKPSILLTPSSFAAQSPGILDLAKDFHLIFNPYKRKLAKGETIELLEKYQPIGIIAGTETYDEEVLKVAKELKCISRLGVGTDSIDLSYAESREIQVLKTEDYVSNAVVELVISLIFALSRKVYQSCYDLKNGVWKKQMGQSVEGKTLGIVGYGKIGKLLGKKVSFLGVEIVFYDPFIKDSSEIEVGRALSYEELLKVSDIVSFNCSMVNSKPLWTYEHAKLMKKTAFLINCARGGIVCESSLLRALNEGLLAAAGLDVYKEEPYTGELVYHENLICTPHQGSYSKESRVLMERDAMSSLVEFLK